MCTPRNTGTGEITRIEVKPGYELGAITSVAKDARLLGADGLLVMHSRQHLGHRQLQQRAGAHLARRRRDRRAARLRPPSVLHFPAEFKRIGSTFYLANLNFTGRRQRKTKYKGAQIAAVDVR